MRLFAIFVLLALASIFSPGPGHLEAADMKTLLNGAMESLGEVKGSPGLCVLTDANYVNLNGKSAVGYVDLIQEVTGCSVGRGNLLFFQRKQSHPLIIALLKKDTRDCVVIRHDGREAGSVKVNIHPDSVAAPGAWERVSESLGSDAFALVNIGDAWAGGAPYDFLKCAELHNHICPGLCSGYFIAKFIQEKYPLAEGESYSFIACPNWCKDDAVQV
ncbi:MAG: FmdE family protein, partial [Gemmatimonadota bacterium]|nr:FmdE family protein [Gemmatimonadota bacterium]